MHPRNPHLHFFNRKETQGKETPGSANSHINCIAQQKADKLGAIHLKQYPLCYRFAYIDGSFCLCRFLLQSLLILLLISFAIYLLIQALNNFSGGYAPAPCQDVKPHNTKLFSTIEKNVNFNSITKVY